ncbi:hypothetical protein D030_3283A, partial [Vibrio parahaemolyticus AQ3810]
MDNFKRF